MALIEALIAGAAFVVLKGKGKKSAATAVVESVDVAPAPTFPVMPGPARLLDVDLPIPESTTQPVPSGIVEPVAPAIVAPVIDPTLPSPEDAARLEAERLAALKAEADRIATLEAQRLAALEAERIAKAERDRLALIASEAERIRLAAEQIEADKRAAAQAELDLIEAERRTAELAAAQESARLAPFLAILAENNVGPGRIQFESWLGSMQLHMRTVTETSQRCYTEWQRRLGTNLDPSAFESCYRERLRGANQVGDLMALVTEAWKQVYG